MECNELLIANDRVLFSGHYCTCLAVHGRDGEKIPLNLQLHQFCLSRQGKQNMFLGLLNFNLVSKTTANNDKIDGHIIFNQ